MPAQYAESLRSAFREPGNYFGLRRGDDALVSKSLHLASLRAVALELKRRSVSDCVLRVAKKELDTGSIPGCWAISKTSFLWDVSVSNADMSALYFCCEVEASKQGGRKNCLGDVRSQREYDLDKLLFVVAWRRLFVARVQSGTPYRSDAVQREMDSLFDRVKRSPLTTGQTAVVLLSTSDRQMTSALRVLDHETRAEWLGSVREGW